MNETGDAVNGLFDAILENYRNGNPRCTEREEYVFAAGFMIAMVRELVDMLPKKAREEYIKGLLRSAASYRK